jgi:23S rRNA pseudoU1915 N3-methylase RlmH
MDPIFKRCLQAITKINEDLIPTMNHSYNSLMRNMQTTIQNNQSLNQSRQFAKAAKEAQDSNKLENKNIRHYVSCLIETDGKLDVESRYLTDLLNNIKSNFLRRSKMIANKNMEFLQEMKNGNTPAEELLLLIIALGKDVQKVVNEEIHSYQKEIESYIKKAENKIVDDAYMYYNKIIKLDSGTLPAIKTREWTYLPDELFRTGGAYVNTSYAVS